MTPRFHFLFKNKKSYTELVVYPNFPKCNVKFNLEIYNNTGIKIKKLNSVLKISNKLNKPIYLDIKKILDKDNIKINYKKDHLIKLIVDGNGKVPTRLKFGLNLGLKINLMFLQIFVLTPMFRTQKY